MNFSKARVSMVCELCRKEKDVKDSHVIPKFVVKWLKDTSATGYVRQAEKPNIRKQDIDTRRLLCDSCEGMLSRFETLFANRIFLPFQNEGLKEFEYEEWLQTFAVSVFWRLGVSDLDDFRSFKPHLTCHLEKALEIWRRALLSGDYSTDVYDHHILFLDYVKSTGVDLPDGFHKYMLRSVDATVMANAKEVFIYIKLPGIILLSGVKPADPEGWQGTKIEKQGKVKAGGQEVKLRGFGEFLVHRAQTIAWNLESISDKQTKRIAETVERDLDWMFRSDTLKADLADERLKKRK